MKKKHTHKSVTLW